MRAEHSSHQPIGVELRERGPYLSFIMSALATSPGRRESSRLKILSRMIFRIFCQMITGLYRNRHLAESWLTKSSLDNFLTDDFQITASEAPGHDDEVEEPVLSLCWQADTSRMAPPVCLLGPLGSSDDSVTWGRKTKSSTLLVSDKRQGVKNCTMKDFYKPCQIPLDNIARNLLILPSNLSPLVKKLSIITLYQITAYTSRILINTPYFVFCALNPNVWMLNL